MTSLILRRLGAADAPAVCRLEQRDYIPTLSESGYRREMGSNELARYWGLFAGESLVAYGGSWLIADEVHISILVVDRDHRRKGIGQFLLLHLLLNGAERGAVLAVLEVRRSNRPAQALYLDYGFVQIDERPRYYHNGEDALVMLRDGLDDPPRLAAWRRRYATLAAALPVLPQTDVPADDVST